MTTSWRLAHRLVGAYDHDVPIAENVSRYATLVGDVLDIAGRARDMFGSSPATRARRMRRRAARLEHRARRVAGRLTARALPEHKHRRLFLLSAELHARAVALWAEAQAIQPINAELAARLDGGVAVG